MISAMPPPLRRAEAVFVGRHRELVELRTGLEDAGAGRGRFFLVGGEAGIGKTRLVEELAREAAERGHLVLWGRCWESEGAPPYWPWIQVIRESLRTAHAEGGLPLVAGGAGAPYLAQLVPELGGLKSPAPSVPPQSEHARFYLFDAVATFLRSRPDQTPLVLVFDDLQWADTPSLLLLQFLVHELRDTAMLVVATYREMEARPGRAVQGRPHARVGRRTRVRPRCSAAGVWARSRRAARGPETCLGARDPRPRPARSGAVPLRPCADPGDHLRGAGCRRTGETARAHRRRAGGSPRDGPDSAPGNARAPLPRGGAGGRRGEGDHVQHQSRAVRRSVPGVRGRGRPVRARARGPRGSPSGRRARALRAAARAWRRPVESRRWARGA